MDTIITLLVILLLVLLLRGAEALGTYLHASAWIVGVLMVAAFLAAVVAVPLAVVWCLNRLGPEEHVPRVKESSADLEKVTYD